LFKQSRLIFSEEFDQIEKREIRGEIINMLFVYLKDVIEYLEEEEPEYIKSLNNKKYEKENSYETLQSLKNLKSLTEKDLPKLLYFLKEKKIIECVHKKKIHAPTGISL
jgi:hypothetical protein